MLALIFGGNSQDGHYLKKLFSVRNIEAIDISRSGNNIKGDVSEYECVEYFIKQYKPDYVIHLAAKSNTYHDALFENYNTIVTGTMNILEVIKRCSPTTKVFITGSGLQFKNDGSPISEKNQFDANSAYAVSRIQSVYAARYYRTLGIQVYVGYLFHHESPYRKNIHVSKKIALAAKRIALGSGETLEIGDISFQKEWTHANDISLGIIKLLDQNQVFEATIGSGVSYSIEQWLDQCFSLLKLDWKNHTVIKTGYISKYSRLVSDPKTINTLGWYPQIKFDEMAEIVMRESVNS